MPRLVTPEQLVQLHLEAHGKSIGNDPVGEFTRSQFAVRRGKQDGTTILQFVFVYPGDRPLIIFPACKDDLDLIVSGQVIQIAPEIPRHFTRARRFQVDDLAYACIDVSNLQCSRSFQRNLMALVTQGSQQDQATLLRQRFATGHADMANSESCNGSDDLIDIMPFATVKRIFGIAPDAA